MSAPVSNNANRYQHLELPIGGLDFERKKRRGGFGYSKADRDNTAFYQTETKKLVGMQERFNNDKEKYKKYFNPNLIFKINVSDKQSITDDGFRNELERLGINTISSAPDKRGYWVAATDDEKFTAFKEKMKERAGRDKPNVIDAIEGIEDIPVADKIGESLQSAPISDGEVPYLDVEVWRMYDGTLKTFLVGLQKLIEAGGGRVTDTLVTDNFCLLRILVNKRLFEQVVQLREIAHIDRPPRVKLEAALQTGLPQLEVSGPPPANACGVLVLDSGIKHHPLLHSAIGGEMAEGMRNGMIVQNKTDDEAGHGTKVASIALYGDVKECIDSKTFRPELWLYSAKVMYADPSGNATFDPEELLEHQLQNSVQAMIAKNPMCKIINVSIGNTANKMFTGQRQFSLASLIDELAEKHGLIFVVSAGNNEGEVSTSANYPDSLLENTKRVKIIDPASSTHALTVGSLFKQELDGRSLDFPSQFTRVGPGLRGMIKPELVEYGGGHGHEIVTINPDWIKEGRLFTLDKGTSLSAPKVAHQLAKLKNKYPSISNNLVKALLISSTRIPYERPGKLQDIHLSDSAKVSIHLLNVYGYGKPDIDRALYSEDNRVLLLYDGEMALNQVNFFTVRLPDIFIKERGERSIAVSLVFDPPVNRNRLDYLGVTMEAHLFKNKDLADIEKAYSNTTVDGTEEEVVPEKIKKYEVKLNPGVNLRKKGVHQKSIVQFKHEPDIDTTKPLVLAVVSQNRWVQADDYVQPYAVIVSLEHSNKIDLYNQVQLRNKIRARLRP